MTTSFERIAGRLCLDFVNTVSLRPRGPNSTEYLGNYSLLLAWSRQAGSVSTRHARALAAQARAQPQRALRVLREARALRECMHRLFVAVIARRPPPAGDLRRFDTALAAALAHRHLRARGRGFVHEWSDAATRLDSVLWPLLLSAETLLCADDPDRLGACSPPEGCGWLYYDTSKNRSRRWCSMASCGNTVKARRHYARHRSRGAH
jgi:predicted RNA-binding Zn ribbon-like protein